MLGSTPQARVILLRDGPEALPSLNTSGASFLAEIKGAWRKYAEMGTAAAVVRAQGTQDDTGAPSPRATAGACQRRADWVFLTFFQVSLLAGKVLKLWGHHAALQKVTPSRYAGCGLKSAFCESPAKSHGRTILNLEFHAHTRNYVILYLWSINFSVSEPLEFSFLSIKQMVKNTRLKVTMLPFVNIFKHSVSPITAIGVRDRERMESKGKNHKLNFF